MNRRTFLKSTAATTALLTAARGWGEEPANQASGDVFGTHRLTAQLPDGRRSTKEVHWSVAGRIGSTWL